LFGQDGWILASLFFLHVPSWSINTKYLAILNSQLSITRISSPSIVPIAGLVIEGLAMYNYTAGIMIRLVVKVGLQSLQALVPIVCFGQANALYIQ